jgi:hypothetical protein
VTSEQQPAADDEVASTPVAHFSPEYLDTKVATTNLESTLQAIRARRRTRDAAKLSQYAAHINLHTEDPVLVVFLGDAHLGSGDTDHDRFFKDLHRITTTPGVYTIFGGNMIDNAIPKKFPDGMLQNAIPPEEQVTLMRKITCDLNEQGKLLAVLETPCHEGWTYAATGQDIHKLIYDVEGRKFPIMENGSKLLLKTGQIEYYLAIYHQLGPFNSNLNKNNGTQRMRRLQHRNADIVTAAHHHTAEAMQTYCDKQDDQKPVCYLRTGCYKLDDLWAGGKGYIKGEPGGQSVRLYPDKKVMQPYLDLNLAIDEHTAITAYRRATALQRRLNL